MSRSKCRFFGSLTTIVAAGLLLVSPGVVLGVTTVTIGNNDPSFDGTYLNAGNIADALAFTTVQIIADSTITIEDDIDLATALIP